MKLHSIVFSLVAVFVTIGSAAQAQNCAEVNAEVLSEGMERNRCPGGAAPTSEGRLEMSFDRFKATNEILAVYSSGGTDRISLDSIGAALRAKKAYPGTVDIAQLVWQCGNRTLAKQIVLVGNNCEQLGPSFHYYSHSLKSAPSTSSGRSGGSLENMWYY